MPHKITEENDLVDICDNCFTLMPMEQDCTSKSCKTTDHKETLKLCELENGSIRIVAVDLGPSLKE